MALRADDGALIIQAPVAAHFHALLVCGIAGGVALLGMRRVHRRPAAATPVVPRALLRGLLFGLGLWALARVASSVVGFVSWHAEEGLRYGAPSLSWDRLAWMAGYPALVAIAIACLAHGARRDGGPRPPLATVTLAAGCMVLLANAAHLGTHLATWIHTGEARPDNWVFLARTGIFAAGWWSMAWPVVVSAALAAAMIVGGWIAGRGAQPAR